MIIAEYIKNPLREYVLKYYIRGLSDKHIISKTKKEFGISHNKALRVLSLIKGCHSMKEVNSLFIY